MTGRPAFGEPAWNCLQMSLTQDAVERTESANERVSSSSS